MNKAVFLSILLLSGILFAQSTNDPVQQVKNAAREFCKSIVNLVAVVSMLMIVFAGVVYAGGQMMGAETRARANVWATAALVGAVIGILIVVVTPEVLKIMYGGNISCSISCQTGQTPCGNTCCSAGYVCNNGVCVVSSGGGGSGGLPTSG
ncbi:MAG: hypothetical protein QXN37_04025 [Candidatus Anstonellaceae archaeon]